MGELYDERTEANFALAGRTLVGRAPNCLVRIDDPRVSGPHALVSWSGEGWEVRDLGSRNGTWVDDRRLAAGEAVSLGLRTRLSFGAPGLSWQLADGGPPTLLARAMPDGEVARGEAGMLLLPDPEDPEVALYQGAAGGWIAEPCDEGAELLPVADLQVIVAGGRSWQLYLPGATPRTIARSTARPRLHFRVSGDEEYVEMTLHLGSKSVSPRPRAYTYLLLTLARQRLAEAEHDPAERGWIHHDDLAHGLRVEPNTIHVQLFRARQALRRALAREGVDHDLILIERRRGGARQIRMAVDDLSVDRIGEA